VGYWLYRLFPFVRPVLDLAKKKKTRHIEFGVAGDAY
jgi:hypothetical protein